VRKKPLGTKGGKEGKATIASGNEEIKKNLEIYEGGKQKVARNRVCKSRPKRIHQKRKAELSVGSITWRGGAGLVDGAPVS